MSDDHGIRDLLPGHALGCLSQEEEAQVKAHLPQCRQCREELAAWQEVTGSLAFGVPESIPPAGLEARVMARLGARRPARRASSFFQFRHPVLAAVASVLIVVLAGGNIAFWAKSRPRSAAAASLVTVFLTGTSDARDAYGTIVIDREDNHGIMAVRGLPSLAPARVYQLWLIRDGERRSGGVFSVNADGYGSLQIEVPRDFSGFTSVGVSIEPATGSPAPTGARVMKGNL